MNLTTLQRHGIPVFGDTKYRGKCPSEMAEQVSFLALLRIEFPELAEIAVHIENEGKRKDGLRKQQQGMQKGASDIVIPCSPPILIELKVADNSGRVSPEQVAYLARSIRLGAFGCVALGAAGAMEAVRHYVATISSRPR